MGQIQRLSNRILEAVGARPARSRKVLVVSRETNEPIRRLCSRLKMELNFAASLSLALASLQDGDFDVVIYDQDLHPEDWRTALTALAQTSPQSSILLLSTLRQPELWQEVIQRGGHDMLSKPISEHVAESTIAMAMARARLYRRAAC